MAPKNTNFALGSRAFGPDGYIWQLNGTQTNKTWVKTQFTRKESEGGLFGRGKWDTTGYIDWSRVDNDGSATKVIKTQIEEKNLITIGPLEGSSPSLTNTTARYPSDALIDGSSDYVYFQFGKYKPPFSREAAKANIDIIRLIAPTTSSSRAKKICSQCSGYVYYISVKGITGAANLDADDVKDKVSELRLHTDLPIAIGFGIKDAASASSVKDVADGIVAGSVFVDLIGEGDDIIDKVSLKTKELFEVLN